jgi:predicted dehydrogenase
LTVYETAHEPGPHGPLLLPRSEKIIPLPAAEPLRVECEAFLDSIRTRQPPITDGRSGLRALAVLEAAQHSIELGGWQDVVT